MELLLTLIDDNVLFSEWSKDTGIQNISNFLLAFDLPRYKVRISDIFESDMCFPIQQYLIAQAGTFSFSSSLFNIIQDFDASEIDLKCFLSTFIELCWNIILDHFSLAIADRTIWKYFRKIQCFHYNYELLHVLNDDNVHFFSDYLLDISADYFDALTWSTCKQCWRIVTESLVQYEMIRVISCEPIAEVTRSSSSPTVTAAQKG